VSKKFPSSYYGSQCCDFADKDSSPGRGITEKSLLSVDAKS